MVKIVTKHFKSPMLEMFRYSQLWISSKHWVPVVHFEETCPEKWIKRTEQKYGVKFERPISD